MTASHRKPPTPGLAASLARLQATMRPAQPRRKRGPAPAATAPAGTLGERVRARREALGWTQGQLADALGATRQWVSAIETSVRVPRLETVERLATVLGMRGRELDERLR